MTQHILLKHLIIVESKTWTYVPRASQHGAAHGGTAGPGRDGQHRTPTGRFAQEKTALLIYSPDNGKMISWAFLWKHEQSKPYVNLRRNKNCG